MCHHCNYISSPRLSVSSQLSWTLKMLLENILLLFQEKKWDDKDFRSRFLCCSGQFRCNGAWNRAAGKTQYSAPLLRQNILTQTLPWKKGGYALIYFSVQVQLQFYFRRENNSQFEANPFHTLEHIHNCLCLCIHHFIPVQQTILLKTKQKFLFILFIRSP